MVRQHEEDDRQRQIVVMRRTKLGDLAIFGVWRTASLQIIDDNALVRHDNEEHIGAHNRGCEGTQMKQRSAT